MWHVQYNYFIKMINLALHFCLCSCQSNLNSTNSTFFSKLCTSVAPPQSKLMSTKINNFSKVMYNLRVCVPIHSLVLVRMRQDETGGDFLIGRDKTTYSRSHWLGNFGDWTGKIWDGTELLSTPQEKSWMVLKCWNWLGWLPDCNALRYGCQMFM